MTVLSAPLYWIIIPAAGIGSRMGHTQPKQYLRLAGRSVIERTLTRCLSLPSVAGIVVALHPDDRTFSRLPIAQDSRVTTVTGGSERCDTVLAALQHLCHQANAEDWVLVHDAARPCVRPATIERLFEQLSHHPVGGLLGVPVSDTVKHVVATQVQHTLDRSSLWQAQTPQCFRYGLLRQALQDALAQGQPITDEASAIEWAGYQPQMVLGDSDNIKLTRPNDRPLLEAILQYQAEEML